MSTLEKIENAVVEGYKNIEEGVVEGYKKIEEGVVGKYEEISDSFIEKHLMKDGETLEEAKTRIAAELPKVNTNVNVPNSEEIVKKNLEASKNAGKR